MSFVLLAVIGVAVSFASIAGLIASLIVPSLIFCQGTRLRAGIAGAIYYGSALWAIVPVAGSVLGPALPGVAPALVWITATLLLALPWAICWSTHFIRIRVLLAVALSIVPPLGVIGLASPLLASGYLFPGTALFGFFGASLLTAELAVAPSRAAVVGLIAALAANGAFTANLAPPPGWVGLNTRQHSDNRDPFLIYAREQDLQRSALAEPAQVLIFPESIVLDWTRATDEFWEHTVDQLRQSGRTIAVGATIPASHGYRNGLIVRGAEMNTFDQRVPVPLGMWHPFTNGGVSIKLSGRGTLDLGGRRVAALICYEQLLVWPMLSASLEQPTVLVAISNLASVPVGAIEECQRTAVRSWARLFNLPLVTAVNSLL